MIQLQPAPTQQIQLTPEIQSESQLGGIVFAIAIIMTWAASLTVLLCLDISGFNFFALLALIAWQTFLYTGLFITAHDAMHGVVYRQNNKINHFIGSLCLGLYGLLPYKKLMKKHWQHHHHPASEQDPDFHDGKHKNFFAWYLYFMKNYWSWKQIIALMVIYNVIVATLHIPSNNLTYFWVIPSILSSVQLFYFGTYLPHQEPETGYSEPHRSQTIAQPTWLSFITCYHFNYHEEHHEYPHMAWWQLPQVYQLRQTVKSN